jgi:hypothetical protein
MHVAGQNPKSSVEARRAERELFFWTAHQWLRLVVLVALVLYSIVSLIEGHVPGLDLLLRSL